MLGFLKDIAGPLIGGLFGFGGGERANAANAQMARDQMAFQERMRSTQWQTAVADMKAAGLNPALAYQQGGSGTPTGATASMQNTATAGIEGAASALSSIQQLRKNAAEINLLTQQADKANQERQLIGTQTILANISKELGTRTFAEALERIRAESAGAQHSAREAAASAKIRELEIPEAEAIAAFYRTAVGKILPGLTSAAGVFRGLSGLGAIFSRGRSLRR